MKANVKTKRDNEFSNFPNVVFIGVATSLHNYQFARLQHEILLPSREPRTKFLAPNSKPSSTVYIEP